jgi:D-alanyl-D-alanine carboxypeptidase
LSIDPLVRPSTSYQPEGLPPPRRPPNLRRGAIASCVVATIAGLAWFAASGDDPGAQRVPADALAPPTSAMSAQSPGVAEESVNPGIDQPGSDWWVVNRDRPLPDGYVPPELVTPAVPIKPGTPYTEATPVVAAAFEAMVAAALQDGYELQLTGGYRSFDAQQEMYDRFVRDYGAQVAAERVALPGRSEHQTGLAVDVGEVDLPDDEEFGETASSAWVRDNAHRFGFIVRYPPDKADITGYANEPWHLRYVGVDLATELHGSGLTMEEHFGLVPAAVD